MNPLASARAAWRAALFILLVPLAPLAHAWEPLPHGVWPDGTVDVAFEFATTAPHASVSWDSAAAQALSTWNGQAQRIQLHRAVGTGQPQYDNTRNELFFSPTLYGQPFPSGVLAATLITADNGQIVEADVVFNRAESWSLYSGLLQTGRIDFGRVVLHELGHVLGLDHPDDYGDNVAAIMNSVVSGTEVLTPDDKDGVHSLYDHGTGARPKLLAISPDASVVQGAAAELRVRAGGRRPFTFTWQHDGIALPGVTGGTLNLPATALADAGSYTVVIANAGGYITTPPMKLTVTPAALPKGTLVTFTVHGYVGSLLGLSVSLNMGTYPVTYEWKRNGVSLPGATNSSLVLAEAQFSDAGDYTVVVSNAAGSTTIGPQHLDVYPATPPSVDVDPQSQMISAGASCSLYAKYSGSPPLTLSWLKDGVVLPHSNSGTYNIPQFTANDVGRYKFRVENGATVAISREAVLTLAPGAQQYLSAQPRAITDFPHAQAVFSVVPSATNGMPNILGAQWYHDGLPVVNSTTPGAAISGATSITLTIAEIVPADAGLYHCEIQLADQTLTSLEARLEVLPPRLPTIIDQPSSQTVVVGGTVTLNATPTRWFLDNGRTSSYPPYTYQWYKDGQPIPAATDDRLVFPAQLTDAGSYFLRINSLAGSTDSDSVSVAVTSGPLPIIKVQPYDLILIAEGGEKSFSWSTALDVWARRNIAADQRSWGDSAGTPLRSGINSPGSYTLVATTAGVTEVSRVFTIRYLEACKPLFVMHPRGLQAWAGDTVDFSAYADGRTSIAYQWFHNGVALPGATNAGLQLTSLTSTDAGDYTVTATNAAGTTTSESARLIVSPSATPLLLKQPISSSRAVGTLTVTAAGGGLSYQWLKDGAPISGATSDSYNPLESASYTVVVTNAAGSVTSLPAVVRIRPPSSAPEIVTAPADQHVPFAGTTTFTVVADGDPAPAQYQWRHDGRDLPGAIDARLRITNASDADAGYYTVTIANSAGAITSAPALLTIDHAARLANISTRAPVGTGSDILIAGFVIQGTQPRSVLVRGIGGQLVDFGVAGVLRNPLLRVLDAHGAVIAESDDWNAGDEWDTARRDRMTALANAAAQIGAFPLRTDTRDSALLTTLTPGAYTAQVSGFLDTTGVALVEAYEIDSPATTRVINLSSRSYVRHGSSILIAGVVVSGEAPRRLLLRGAGPALAGFGVAGALAQPVLRVYRGSELVAENEGWDASGAGPAIAAASTQVGAFAFAPGGADTALLLDLPPGAYTVQISGGNDSTGVALAEAYEVADH